MEPPTSLVNQCDFTGNHADIPKTDVNKNASDLDRQARREIINTTENTKRPSEAVYKIKYNKKYGKKDIFCTDSSD